MLLIDEIDKADIEFPNDLLQELDRMEFLVYETGETVRARKRPVVIITSNNEKELPGRIRHPLYNLLRSVGALQTTRRTGRIVEVGLSVDTIRQYRERYKAWRSELERQSSQHGVRYVPCSTERTVQEVVLSELRAGRVVR